VLDLA